MKSIQQLLKFMRGNAMMYGLAIFAVFVSTVASLSVPVIIQYIIDDIIGQKRITTQKWVITATGETILGACIAILVLTLIRGIFIFIKGWASAYASERIAKRIKDQIMGHLQQVSYDFYSSHDTGDLIQRTTSDVETIRKFLSVQVVEVVNVIMMVITIACMMYALSPKLMFVALSLIPIIVGFSFYFFFNIRKKFKVCDEAEGKLSSMLQENLNGIKVVKAFGREPYEIERFDVVNRDLRDKVQKLIQSFAYYWSLSDLMCFSQIALVVIFGSIWCLDGSLSIGVVFAFVTYEGMLLFPIRVLGRVLSEFGKSLVSVDRIKEILDTTLDYVDDGVLEPHIRGSISFKDVSFSYDGVTPVLKNMNFEVSAGETIGILGPTGSGKSTMAYLMTRLYEPTKGSVLIDGISTKDIRKQWIRKNIGLVLQETFLYAKSISDNIGIKHEMAQHEHIVEAAKIATLHHNIMDFDAQYETVVGEKGVSLSGGQRQRVAIARTILKPMPIMIFDDSLSAVDTETDRMIRNALKKSNSGGTTFIMSHRINTLAETDRVMVIENGQVSAFDTHENLVQQDGLYKRIWEVQNMVGLEENFGA